MAVRKWLWLSFALPLLIGGCMTTQHISRTDVTYKTVRADTATPEDPTVTGMIAPYKLKLDAVMNEVLGTLPADLSKGKPESALGNWVSDAIVSRLSLEGYSVDLAVVNYGGLRVPYLTAGPLTRGELFELSPFDNTLMIVDVPGAKLDSFFLLIAEQGGWPISKQARLVINDKKLVSAKIDGQSVDPNRIYKVATVDYVANGGDNMKVLIPLARRDTALLFRDVLIDNVVHATAAGHAIAPQTDGRITVQ